MSREIRFRESAFTNNNIKYCYTTAPKTFLIDASMPSTFSCSISDAPAVVITCPVSLLTNESGKYLLARRWALYDAVALQFLSRLIKDSISNNVFFALSAAYLGL